MGFDDASVLCFGTGAVTNTLMALMNQITTDLSLFSGHADHITSGGVQLHHRSSVYEVPAGGIAVHKDMSTLAGKNPRVIVNGRQVGGNYDQIFDACGDKTEYIVTAQNGLSSQALYRAAQDYISRNPSRADTIRNIVGIDAAMFVKMSAVTDNKSATILQPGARWLFGAFDMRDGSGTGLGGSFEVQGETLKKAEAFTEMFRLLDADDGKNADDVKLNAQAVSGKLVKTANNIGGNYGAAIITRVVQNMNAEAFHAPAFTAPLPYGVLNEGYVFCYTIVLLSIYCCLPAFSDTTWHESNHHFPLNQSSSIDTTIHPHHLSPYRYDLKKLAPLVGKSNLEALRQEVRKVREMSLAAVREFYDLNAADFEAAGFSKVDVIQAAQLYVFCYTSVSVSLLSIYCSLPACTL
jgi:hypothetical protein